MEDLILLVEDDEDTGSVLKDFLEVNDLNVIWATEGKNAIQQFKEAKPHLVLLDVILPDINGLEVAAEIRKLNGVVPIIFMTGTALDKENYNKAFRLLQAANYMNKPISPEKALAQIQGLLHPLSSVKRYHIHDYYITIDGQQVTINNAEFQLRERDAQVFSLLLDRINSPVTRTDLLLGVWKDDDALMNNALDAAISHIRKELKIFTQIKIRTIHGRGYKLVFECNNMEFGFCT